MQKIHKQLPETPTIYLHFEGTSVQVNIETSRLFIRSYLDQDFESCVTLYTDETLTKYFDHGRPRSKEEVKALVKERGSKYFNNSEPFGLFSVFRKEDMAFIGQVDLVPLEPGILEAGCIFHRQYHNNGFCPEALRALIFGYTEYLNSQGITCQGFPTSKIVASVHPNNYASIRICKHLGMIFDGSKERFEQPRLWYSYTFESSPTIGIDHTS